MIYRSLKMRSNADSSGNGYIYEKGDLIETESISAAEKEEFSELTEFVKSKLNNANAWAKLNGKNAGLVASQKNWSGE